MKTIIFLAIIVAICAWCPWFAPQSAQTEIAAAVTQQEVVNSRCVLTVEPNSIYKAWFGYKEVVGYNCSLIGESVTTGENNVLGTFWGSVINLPSPDLG